MNEPEENQSVEIPHTELSAEALRGVIESFVLREGTEYGSRDFTLDEKVAQVIKQLERREARIVFDPATETIDLVVKPR
ncbi:MAG: YheU family protein [Gammaproteobacteria bacterium]